MRLFKHLIIILFFSTFSLLSSGQVLKFKSTSLSFKTKNEYSKKWSKWSDAKQTEVLITVDTKNDRIRIFSKEEQTYDIIKYFEKTYDSDGDETLQYHCVNEDGLKCYVRFMVLNSVEGQKQLYIDFADMMWVYNIYLLE